MIQLYTKNIDNIYVKVNWNNLKVTPNKFILEAIDQVDKELGQFDGQSSWIDLLKKELNLK